MIRSIFIYILLLTAINLIAFDYDYLNNSTNYGTAITPESSAYGDVVSTTINVTNVEEVLLLSSMEMRRSGISTQGREVWYNIVNNQNSNSSGEIYRQVQAIDSDDYGIGTLVHIFDTSGFGGDVTFTLRHKNIREGTDRHVETNATLTAIAMQTAISDNNLSNAVKRLDNTGATTTSNSYSDISALISSPITLPINGAIYVSASINCRETGADNTVGEWKLRYRPAGGSWNDTGIPVSRTMSIGADDGIVSLVSIVENLTAGNYEFTIAHKADEGIGEVKTILNWFRRISCTIYNIITDSNSSLKVLFTVSVDVPT